MGDFLDSSVVAMLAVYIFQLLYSSRYLAQIFLLQTIKFSISYYIYFNYPFFGHSLRVLQLAIVAPSLGCHAGFCSLIQPSWAGSTCKLQIFTNRGSFCYLTVVLYGCAASDSEYFSVLIASAQFSNNCHATF